MKNQGTPILEICKIFKCSTKALYKRLNKNKNKQNAK